jgi:hypothetical protein
MTNPTAAYIRQQIASLRDQVAALDKQIAVKKQAMTNTINSGGSVSSGTQSEYSALVKTRDDKRAELISLQETLKDYTTDKDTAAWNAYVQDAVSTNSLFSQANNNGTIVIPSRGLQYNVPSVKEAYFSSRTSFLDVAKFSSNKPASVSSAEQLWTSALASKGMIVSYLPATDAPAYAAGSAPSTAKPFFGRNYGFQFMYNPGTVNMSYTGAPNVDVALQASGTEKFNLMGTSSTQSTISFELILNRMFDMKYYNTDGSLKENATTAYAGRLPTGLEQKAIFDKGTMYDVEYLLRTLLGYTLKSYLRDGDTADMGYLGARPVELHLGKNLRYLGTVTSINLRHVIFNENMVPLFSNLSISFARIPDYPIATQNR